MSNFCCGASKIGGVGTIHQDGITINQVPILYCPVCHDVEVHPKVKENIDVVIEISQTEGTKRVNLEHYMKEIRDDHFFEDCSSVNRGNVDEVVQSQIDISLGLLSFAKDIGDLEWQEELKGRLSKLSQQRDVTTNR
ncbi:hypothetical protein [Tepidibacillus marianensis]|uniref:hypothetical protein n=1 Tax=Tepidibacillus marianensis TaxID=3131995 RepID=UPI0030CB1526